MDRKNLLALLRTQYGYTGDDSLEAVKKFASEANIEFAGKSIEDIFQPARKSIILTDPTDADDEDDAHDDAVDARQKGVEDARRAVAALKGGRDGQAIGKVRDRIEDDPSLGYGEFKTGFGRFMADVRKASIYGLNGASETFQKAVRVSSKAAGLGETIDSEGGFLVPTAFVNTLLEKTYDNSQLISRTQVIPMGGPVASIPTVNETSRVDGSRAGGVRGYWTAEAASMTGSQPAFGRVTLNSNDLTILVYITQQLIDDSAISLPPIINRLAADELQFKLQDAFVNGTGAGQPLGILNAAATVSVAKEAGQAAATINYTNVLKMYSRLWARSRQNGVWFINQDVEPQLHTMSLPVGTGGLPVYLPPSGASGSPYATLFGMPVVPIEQCATLGTVGDIVLADMSQYLFGRRQDIRAEESMHVRFLTNEMAYRFVMRADGKPWWNSALTPFKGSNTQSPFITLATRA